MKIAIITLQAFNELDSFIASALLNRVDRENWEVNITGPEKRLTSMNGLVIEAQQPLQYANEADIVLFGSGMKTADYVKDETFLSQFKLDPEKQIIGAQCSGALFLHHLGLASGLLSTDTMTAPRLTEQGVKISEKPLHIENNIASAGGCLASQYLAAWAIARATDWQTAEDIIHYVAPVGLKDDFVAQAKAIITPHL